MSTNLHSTYEWHDLFDKSFGVTASDCSEYLDWPGKTLGAAQAAVASVTGRNVEDTDWDKLNRFRGQVKFDTYKAELLQANPDAAALEDAKIVFLMRSIGEARAMPELPGGVIRVDALWLSFASFAAQSLFVLYPTPGQEGADDMRLGIALHFATRLLLYEEILRGVPLEKERYQLIWDTWPLRWEDNGDAMIFTWTALGRFLVAHEMAHLLRHHPGSCTEDAAIRRGIVSQNWIDALRSAQPDIGVDDYLYEVEADLEGIRLCLNMLNSVGASGLLLSTFLAALYYMFLCLEELARRVGTVTAYPQRRYCIGRYLGVLTGSDDLSRHSEEQFHHRARLYFDIAEELRGP